MKKTDIIEFFDGADNGVRKTAEAFGVTTQAVYAWKNKVRKHIALEAAELSDGKLVYDASQYV